MNKLDEINIRERDKEAISKYVDSLKSTFGDRILSIILYGSAVKDNYFPGSSDLNLLVVFPRFEVEFLKDISPIVKGFKGRNKISSYIMGQDEINSSTDVFPIKYLDIKRYHQILLGEDIFADMQIDPSNIRYDLERQLRNISQRLREIYMHSNYTANELRYMVVADFSGFSYHLATLLYLKGFEVPPRKEEIIQMASEKFGLDISSLQKIIELKGGGNTPPKTEMQKIFEDYVKIVETVVEISDTFKVGHDNQV